MSVDWSAFRDGDKIRLSFEGVWMRGAVSTVFGVALDGSDRAMLTIGGHLGLATSAELIERPFTPPAEGTLFRNESLWISDGAKGFRCVRLPDGQAPLRPACVFPWTAYTPEWLAGIEVLDV